MTEKNIKIAFDLFDTDNNGSIDVNEFYHLMTNVDEDKKVEHTKNYVPHKCHIQGVHTHENIDNERWTNILKEIDTNGDGIISYEEFKNGIHKFVDIHYDEHHKEKEELEDGE